jgi:type IV pilus biogenesis protein CpaD/CtpE
MARMREILCRLLPVLLAAGIATGGISGCQKKEPKEKIIDIETPDTDVEIERSKKDGSLDIKIKRKPDEKRND